MDRGGGIGDFQHCIVITRGQEERISKTANVVVGKNHELGTQLVKQLDISDNSKKTIEPTQLSKASSWFASSFVPRSMWRKDARSFSVFLALRVFRVD